MAERQSDLERDERAEHEARGSFDLGVSLMRTQGGAPRARG
jgi:hypothetical protein